MTMNLSQDQLNAFYAVSRLNSFTKAAHEVGITQSALSHRIKNLEAQLEKTLFVRDSSGARLTEAGFRLMDFCRIQKQMEIELLSNFNDTKGALLNGFLRVGGASSVLWSTVVPALASLLDQNPEIQIEMKEDELVELPGLLQRGMVDFIVTCGKLEITGFEEVYLGNEVNVLVEPRKKSLCSDVFLDHDANDETTVRYLRYQGIRKPKIRRSFMDNIHGILSGVEAGFGKAVLPKHLIKDHKSIHIVSGQKEMRIPVYLYYWQQPYYSRLHQAAVSALKDRSAFFLDV